LENAVWQCANAAVATKRKARSSLVTIDACAFLSRRTYVKAKDFQGDDEPSCLWRGQVSYHKGVIRDHPEWQAKLERVVFSDVNIAVALSRTRELFRTVAPREETAPHR
jgi:hypothetical protein